MMKNIFVIIFLALQAAIAYAGDGSCTEISRVCVEGPSTKIISGESVTRSCWKYEGKYNCEADNYTDECQPLIDKGCSQIGSECIEYVDAGSGRCSLYEQKYQCKDKEGGTSTVKDCGNQTYCMDGKCFDAGYPPDADFGMAMTGMEVVRQMGNYLDPASLTLFNGKSSKCSVTLGIFNCCQKNTKAGSDNGSMMQGIGMSLVKDVGYEGIRYLGATNVYDSLYANDMPGFLAEGFGSLFGGSNVSDFAFSPSLSLYGVTVGFGSYVPSLGMTQILSTESLYVGFDPTSFAISVAIQVIVSLMSCDEDEQILALKRGQNLCYRVGSYCSKKVLGVCVQKKQSYCCFNSRLARLVAVAGHAQLGKSWGSSKNPSCGGFTTAEIALIDFSQINFSEVIGEFKSKVKIPDYAIGRAQEKIESYYAPPN